MSTQNKNSKKNLTNNITFSWPRNFNFFRLIKILHEFPKGRVPKLNQEHDTECKNNDEKCTKSGPKTEHKEVAVVFMANTVVDPRAVMIFSKVYFLILAIWRFWISFLKNMKKCSIFYPFPISRTHLLHTEQWWARSGFWKLHFRQIFWHIPEGISVVYPGLLVHAR